MRKNLLALGFGLLLSACAEDDPTTFDPGPHTGRYRIGDAVDLDGDGQPDGYAVDTDDDGIADAVDTNNDGIGDAPLPGTPTGDGDGDGDGDIVGDGDGDVVGDGDGDGDGDCGSISKEAELERGPVDIILAIDTSLSMAPYVCNTANNLTAFANGVGPSARVVSVYSMGALGFLTLACSDTTDPLAATDLAKDTNRYLNVPAMVDSNDAYSVLLAQFDKYKNFLRPDAATHIVLVSDDNEHTEAQLFKSEMEARLGHTFYFHAIVADGQNLCNGFGVGTQHLALADMTGGQKLPICEQDWTGLFGKLEAAVVQSAPLPCDFEIPEPPANETLDPARVQVNFTPVGGSKTDFPRASTKDACGSQLGWHYDNADAPTRIEFCPEACAQVKKGGKVGIAFGCEPPILL